jgi:hypothetical protein
MSALCTCDHGLVSMPWLIFCAFRAENGCFASIPNRSEGPAESVWHKLVTGTHNSWRQPVLEILAYYTERTPGSHVEDRGISIIWRYANTGDHGQATPMSARHKRLSTMSLSADESPIYEDGKGNEAYLWARRQAAEVQNHIMVDFLIYMRYAGDCG